MLDISEPIFKKYADASLCSYTSLELDSEGRPGAWGKIRAIQRYIDDYDYILWIDCDIVILEKHNIFDDFDISKNIGIVEHNIQNEGSVPNTGVLILKNCQENKDLLINTWNGLRYIHHPWWEQASFMNNIGYSLSRPCRKIFDYDSIHWMDLKWNSHPNNMSPNPYFHHVTYGPVNPDIRIKKMKELSEVSKV
jgi:hypothetical protein